MGWLVVLGRTASDCSSEGFLEGQPSSHPPTSISASPYSCFCPTPKQAASGWDGFPSWVVVSSPRVPSFAALTMPVAARRFSLSVCRMRLDREATCKAPGMVHGTRHKAQGAHYGTSASQ